MLGIYVNEMQRSVGFGHHGAGGYYRTRIVPYGHFAPYRPGAIAVDRRTHLGDVPNDFEASVDLQYIPVRQGWYYGQPVDGRGYPDVRGGFGQATPTTPSTPAELDRLTKLERTQTILQFISTLSIATVATLAVIRAIRSRRGGAERFFGEDE